MVYNLFYTVASLFLFGMRWNGYQSPFAMQKYVLTKRFILVKLGIVLPTGNRKS